MEQVFSVKVRYKVGGFATHTAMFYNPTDYNDVQKFESFLSQIKSLCMAIDEHLELEVTKQHQDSSNNVTTIFFFDEQYRIHQMDFQNKKPMKVYELLGNTTKPFKNKEQALTEIMRLISNTREKQVIVLH